MGTAITTSAASVTAAVDQGYQHLAAARVAYTAGVFDAARVSARLAMRQAQAVSAAGHRSGAADTLARRAQHLLAGIDAAKATR